MASVEIRTDGVTQAEEYLAGLAKRAGFLGPLMRNIAAWLETSTRERFETNLSPEGAPWKQSLRAQLHGGRTLVERGLLRDSITSTSGDDYAEVGTNDPRARIHQLGGTIKPVTATALRFRLANGAWRTVRQVVMPARPFLGLSSEDGEEIVELGTEYLLGPSDAQADWAAGA